MQTIQAAQRLPYSIDVRQLFFVQVAPLLQFFQAVEAYGKRCLHFVGCVIHEAALLVV